MFTSLLVLFSKGTGVLYIGLVLLAILTESIPQKRETKQRIMLILFTAIILYEGCITIANKAFDVEKHWRGDTESIIWQTIARTGKYHITELTESEINDLNKFIDIKHAGDVYNPAASDPVKGECLNYSYFETHRTECLMTWLRLGFKYPGTYINAFFAASYGYYYPGGRYTIFYPDNYVTTLQNPYYQSILKDPYVDTYDRDMAYGRLSATKKIQTKLEDLREYPIIGLYGCIG